MNLHNPAQATPEQEHEVKLLMGDLVRYLLEKHGNTHHAVVMDALQSTYLNVASGARCLRHVPAALAEVASHPAVLMAIATHEPTPAAY